MSKQEIPIRVRFHMPRTSSNYTEYKKLTKAAHVLFKLKYPVKRAFKDELFLIMY